MIPQVDFLSLCQIFLNFFLQKAIVKEASLLRDGATDAKEALEDIRDLHQRLRNLAVEVTDINDINDRLYI